MESSKLTKYTQLKEALLYLASDWDELADQIRENESDPQAYTTLRECADAIRFLIDEIDKLGPQATDQHLETAAHNAFALGVEAEKLRRQWEASQYELGEWTDDDST